MEFLGGASFVVVLLLIVVAILWVLMPFAVFGTKDVIREQVKAQERTNALLSQVLDTVRLIHKEQQKSDEAPSIPTNGPRVL